MKAATALEPYVRVPAAVEPWDPRLPAVAAAFAATVRAAAPGLVPEHVGSSAVPGLAGKNYVDLVASPPAPRIPPLADSLVASGWQRQTEPWAFPATRPLLRAAITLHGRRWQSHLHLVAAGDPEVAELVGLRDLLRSDDNLREEYGTRKQALTDDGVTDGIPYTVAKASVVLEALRRLGLRPPLPSGVRVLREADWALLRTTRLTALLDAPDAFLSTHEREVGFAEDVWRRRLRGGGHFGATAGSGELSGIVAGVLNDDDQTERYLVGMWVSPAARGSGTADALMTAVTGWARDTGGDRLVLDVADGNEPARRLYVRHGFQRTGNRWQFPAPRSCWEERYVLPLSAVDGAGA